MVTPPNQSIDYVVDQIERLGGRINDLVLKVAIKNIIFIFLNYLKI